MNKSTNTLVVKKTKVNEKNALKKVEKKEKKNSLIKVEKKVNDNIENEQINNEELIDNLKNNLFTNWKEKEKKINLIIETGNFNASKDKPPWYIILPNQRSKRFWDIFVCMAGIVNVLVVTIDISWNFECIMDDFSIIKTVYTVFTTLFIIDIGFNLITAYLDDKNIYSFELPVIISNYLQNGMVFDVLSALPYDKILTFDYSGCMLPSIAQSKYLYFLFYLRFIGINKFFELIERIFSKYTSIIRLIKLFTFIIFLANTAGNLFCGNSPTVYSIIYKECNYSTFSSDYIICATILTKDKFFGIILYAIYTGILMTLGTDFPTQTVGEEIFLVVIVIISTIMNASIYGNVAVMLGNMSSGVSPLLQEKIDTMTEYMNFMKFDSMFKNQIEDYHLNIWYKQRNMMYDESFFGDMSAALHKIMLLIQYKPTFFLQNKLLPVVSKRFILDMVVLFEPKIYMTNDIIITEGEASRDIFFASNTSYCKVYIGGQWVKDLMCGDYFGEIAIFLRSRRRTSTILCYRDSDFLYVDGDRFEELLRNYPLDYVKIKNRALKCFINSMKFYPSGLFAKLVPNNKLKDYLFRKSIYLEDEEEDDLLNQKSLIQLDSNEYNDKINYIVEKLKEVKNKLLHAKDN